MRAALVEDLHARDVRARRASWRAGRASSCVERAAATCRAARSRASAAAATPSPADELRVSCPRRCERAPLDRGAAACAPIASAQRGDHEQAEQAELARAARAGAGRISRLIGRCAAELSAGVRSVPSTACPRATRSTTPRTASGRCSRATCPTSSRTPHPRFAARPLARAPGRPRGARGRRPRQAPVPALRGRPDDPLAPAHDRLLARARRAAGAGRARRAAPGCVMRRGDARGRAVRRPGARADDRRRARASTSASPRLGPGHPRRRARRRALPAPPARGRPDAPDRRRAARPADDRRASGTCGRPRAASRPGSTRGGATGEVSDDEALAIVDARPPAHAAVGRATASRTASSSVYGRAGRPARAAGAARSARAARATTTARPTGARDASADAARVGHKGADQIAPGNTLGVVRRRARRRRRHDRVRRPARGPRRARHDAGCVLAHDYEHVVRTRSTLEEGLAHLASAPFAGVELDVDLKLPGYEERVVARAARARAGRARARLVAVHAQPRGDLRALEPRAAARLVGPARAARLHALDALTPLPGLRRCCVRAAPAARASPPGTSRAGPLRRGDGALAARHAAPRARRSATRAASSTCGRSTTPAQIRRARGARRHRRDHERPAAVRVGSALGDRAGARR